MEADHPQLVRPAVGGRLPHSLVVVPVRIEYRDDGSIDVYVRQSWVNDAVMCAERGRLGILQPEANIPNDATILGTAVHAGIEFDLEEGHGDRKAALDVAYQTLHDCMQEPMKWIKYNRTQLHHYVPELFDMWARDIRPKVCEDVVETEWAFEYLLAEYVVDLATQDFMPTKIRLWCKGTCDYLGDGTVKLWDWKTAGQKYKPREKQKTAIQPTVYAGAAVAAGLDTWPVRFNYGVMVRDAKEAQIVTVVRRPEHLAWLRQVVKPYVTMALQPNGMNLNWPINDTHYLCSDKWCPFWSQCKGANLSENDMNTPPVAA